MKGPGCWFIAIAVACCLGCGKTGGSALAGAGPAFSAIWGKDWATYDSVLGEPTERSESVEGSSRSYNSPWPNVKSIKAFSDPP